MRVSVAPVMSDSLAPWTMLPPGSSIQQILRREYWVIGLLLQVVIPSSQSRGWTWVSHITHRQALAPPATWATTGNPHLQAGVRMRIRYEYSMWRAYFMITISQTQVWIPTVKEGCVSTEIKHWVYLLLLLPHASVLAPCVHKTWQKALPSFPIVPGSSMFLQDSFPLSMNEGFAEYIALLTMIFRTLNSAGCLQYTLMDGYILYFNPSQYWFLKISSNLTLSPKHCPSSVFS